MKRKLLYLLTALFIGALMWSCGSDDPKESFDESLLNGYWKTGTEYWFFKTSGHSGYYWDPADDVTEEEAKQFTWTLSGSDLTLMIQMEMGSNPVPKYYTITRLTSSQLQMKDSFSSISFTKTTQP